MDRVGIAVLCGTVLGDEIDANLEIGLTICTAMQSRPNFLLNLEMAYGLSKCKLKDTKSLRIINEF